jgi:signal transduction histidine kinase
MAPEPPGPPLRLPPRRPDDSIEIDAQAGDKAAEAARASLQEERNALAERRTRSFLIAQSALLGIAIAAVSLTNASGVMSDLVYVQSIAFCSVVGVLTAGGWLLWKTHKIFRPLVLTLLYADSFLGLLFFYVAGEFETPALMILTACVIMAPIFVGKRHAWGIATAQVVGYAGLLAARQWDLLPFLPYGYMLPAEAVKAPGFVVDCLSNFTIATFGVAYLAGQASIDIVNSQDMLEAEVESQTRALAVKGAELEAANARLARANDALADANRQLHESHSRLEQFNAAVSHDLKAPLQTLMGRAEMIALAGAQNPQRAAALAEDIADTAERMGHQIDELLKLSRLGDRLGSLHPVPLGETLATVSHDLEGRMRRSGARLEIVHPLPTAWGNGALLRELFQNLLENAVKYGGADGAHIRVGAALAPNGEVAVAVEDDGPGVPPSHRDRIFGLFKRLPDHQEAEGVGAGLAIVRRIAEVHGGRVRIEDGRVLPGARFVVTLPAPGGATGRADGVASVH